MNKDATSVLDSKQSALSSLSEILMVKPDSEEPRSLFVGICLGHCHVPVGSATRTRVLPSMAPESSPSMSHSRGARQR